MFLCHCGSDPYTTWSYWRTHGHMLSSGFLSFSFFFKKFFSWSTIDLQCCVNFCCTAKWIIHTHTHTHTYMHTPPLLRYFPIQVNTEYWVEFPVLYSRSLLAIYLYTVVCMHQFQSPNLSLPPHPSPFQKIVAKYTKYKTDHFNRKSNSIKCIHTIVQTLPLSISRTFPSSSTGTLSSWSSNSPFSAPQPLAPTILLSVFVNLTVSSTSSRWNFTVCLSFCDGFCLA